MPKELRERLWEKVDKTPGCWIWRGSRDGSGYGQIGHKGKLILVHRLSYSFVYGEIPPGVSVLHSCDNPPCIRPEHLHLGNQALNMREMVERGRGPNVKGEKNPRAKLNSITVLSMRRMLKSKTHVELAAIFGVSKSTVDQISRGVIWKEGMYA